MVAPSWFLYMLMRAIQTPKLMKISSIEPCCKIFILLFHYSQNYCKIVKYKCGQQNNKKQKKILGIFQKETPQRRSRVYIMLILQECGFIFLSIVYKIHENLGEKFFFCSFSLRFKCQVYDRPLAWGYNVMTAIQQQRARVFLAYLRKCVV